MKKKFYTVLATLLIGASVFAQAPEKMTYQAVVRDGGNQLVSNQTVGMQISILQGSPTGVVVYQETHTPSANSNGLVTLEIGNGVIVSGDFATIDWGNGQYYIKTETDPQGGTNYTITGTTQLMSVPYALYAKESGSSTPGPQGQDGASAYDVWIEQGNTGSEADFLASLAGAQGAAGADGANGSNGSDGASAYDIWLSQGNTGSQTDFINSLQGAQGPAGTNGANGNNGSDGASAYDIWLSQGNTGSQTDFINSLQGAQGPAGTNGANGSNGSDGASAYDIWLSQGNTGSQTDFINSLQGAQGPAGTNGANGSNGSDGASAYDIWLSQGNTGSQTDFINSLQGAQGSAGTNGANGNDGSDGSSAYDIWLSQGNTGSQTDFLNSLEGAQGPQGPQGPAGTSGSTGPFYLGQDTLGGIVFYIYFDGNGDQHGLIVSKTATFTNMQSPASNLVPNNTYDGAANSAQISAASSGAKTFIDGLGTGWYLPSLDELILLYNNRFHANRGLANAGATTLVYNDGFANDYWSSTQYNLNNGMMVNFFSGQVSQTGKTAPKRIIGVKSF